MDPPRTRKLTKAKLPFEERFEAADVLIADGRLAAIGNLESCPAEETWELSGRLLLPGAIDPHVHMDDPGFTEREDFGSGTASALAGGVTTIIDMPETSLPNARTPEGLLAKWQAVRGKAMVDYAFWGGVTGEEVQDGSYREKMTALAALGVVSFKVYTTSGMETYPRVSYGEMRAIFRQAADLGLPVGVHAEDWSLVAEATRIVHEHGGSTWRDYLETRPVAAEWVAVAAAIQLTRETGAHLHIVHLSSAIGVELVAEAKAHGLPVTAETCPHYLLLSEDDFARKGTWMKTMPPVRRHWDQEKLWQGLREGIIDFVATDHAAGRFPEEKEVDNFLEAYSGIPGLQTFYPLLWQEGYVKGRLTLKRFLQVTSSAAAQLYGLSPQKGEIRLGADADLVILNPQTRWNIRSHDLVSKGKYTPFDGWEINGRIERVLIRGRITNLNGESQGEWIKRR